MLGKGGYNIQEDKEDIRNGKDTAAKKIQYSGLLGKVGRILKQEGYNIQGKKEDMEAKRCDILKNCGEYRKKDTIFSFSVWDEEGLEANDSIFS